MKRHPYYANVSREESESETELDPVASATVLGADAPKKPLRRATNSLVPLTYVERTDLEDEFHDLEDCADLIELALAHEAHLKYPTGQQRYVRNWLKREREARARSYGWPKEKPYANGTGRPRGGVPSDDVARIEARTLARADELRAKAAEGAR